MFKWNKKSFSLKDGGLYNPIERISILFKIISKVRISKFPGSCLRLINVEKYSPSIFVSIFCRYAVARYQELTIRKTGVKFTLSHKKNISSFNDWNLFRNKFPLRCHRKTVLGCLLLKSLKVLNISFVFFPLNNCSSELLFPKKHW